MRDETSAASLLDSDRCLLRDTALLTLSDPDAAGLLDRRSNISGWYAYWFSLHGSQLLYFERGQSARRGLLVDKISLFRHKLIVINSPKRRREFEITDLAGKLHVLRAGSDAELHWWLMLFEDARKKIPPAQPIHSALSGTTLHDGKKDAQVGVPTTIVDSHLKVNHILCVVHGIGVSTDILASNTRLLQEGYAEIMSRVFPDVDFRIELLVIHWREALTNLDVHRKLQAVVPVAPVHGEANPLRQFMVHRIVDYVYYTHERYRRHILREIAAQLNKQVESFRQRRPDFDGKVSVLGHSLGAALVYDLMCRKVHDDQVLLEAEGMRLNFDADNLFCIGNPLGTFLGLDPTIGLGADMRKLPFKIFNIFKYHDPIATRLETHWDLANVDVCPVLVPCWFNMGLRESTAQWLGTLWAGGQKKDADAANEASVSGANGYSGSPRAVAERTLRESEPVGPRLGATASGSSADGTNSVHPVQSTTSDRRDDTDRMEERGIDAAATAAVGGGGMRVDFALQASSTMEEVSTSWSALKAHTEYWENRDAMLMMVSCMMKSTFGLSDSAEPEEAAGPLQRVVDENILHKNGSQAALSGREDRNVWGSNKDGAKALEDSVRHVVERMVDEAVAMRELMQDHPDVKVRWGGVTSKTPPASSVELEREGRGSGSSWAAYLGGGWFGSEASGKKN